tara:strand:- start:1706 stop:2263 length:558 start_codon:yes stop_codon:yes gene_type:complete
MNSDLFRGLEIIKPKFFKDERGYFFESFNQKIFKNKISHKLSFCQENESFSKRGVIRGLHYQLPPFAQSKLVRVVHGKVLDVVVDIRKGSPSFGKCFSKELSAENRIQLFIPKGFAHGYITLSDFSIFSYKVDNYYNEKSERGILYNDSLLNIDWKLNKEEFILSEKDQNNPIFSKAEYFIFEDD